MKQQTVLVLGASGFVGSHALQALYAAGDTHVIAACRDPLRLPQDFAGEVRHGDLAADAAYLRKLFNGVDVVVNAFAWTSLFGYRDESRERFLRPTLELIECAMRAGVKRFINISSTSAAAPDHSANAMHPGIRREYWPHLSNVVEIEDYLRDRAAEEFSVVNLRLGLFVGQHYAIGLLPILLPRLKTHLVPWVAGGSTQMPLVDGRDVGQAIRLAATVGGLTGFTSINIVGPAVPTVREVIEYLHRFGYPKPHFSVSFPVAFGFAWLMEKLYRIVPGDPLVTRSIVHLLRNVNADNAEANRILGYQPVYDWRQAIDAQMEEMRERQQRPMRMAKVLD